MITRISDGQQTPALGGTFDQLVVGLHATEAVGHDVRQAEDASDQGPKEQTGVRSHSGLNIARGRLYFLEIITEMVD